MFKDLTLIAMAQKRMDWLSQRQEVLAKNIANGNTPKFQPQDLKPLDFKDALHDQHPGTVQAVTNSMHIRTDPPLPAFAVDTNRKPFESTPDGNASVLEEQMQKVGETRNSYDLTANLVQKYVKMMQTAIGRGS